MNERDGQVHAGRGSFLSIAMDRGRNFMRLLRDDLRAFKLEELAAQQMVVDRRASRASSKEVDAALQAVDRARAHQARVEQLLSDEGAGSARAEAEDAGRPGGDVVEKPPAPPSVPRRTWRHSVARYATGASRGAPHATRSPASK